MRAMCWEESVREPWEVVILGGGFGGLSAAQHLNSKLVEVIDFGRNEWQEWAPGLKSIEEATTIR